MPSLSLEFESLYRQMLRSRRLEEEIARLWQSGAIWGTMHLGIGEEAIVAGILAHLSDDDAVATDHRGTSAMLLKGVDPVLMLREMVGRSDGLCGGVGGHLHMFSKERRIFTTGIVGSSGPAAVGFALAAQQARKGSIAVAFFGEGALNQGMLMESMNLASCWTLPVLFACKDDRWSVTTQADTVTSGDLDVRVRGLGPTVVRVDGMNAAAVWNAAHDAVQRLREGSGPIFLHATCMHPEGHALGLPLSRAIAHPLREMPGLAGSLLGSFMNEGGAPLHERILGVRHVLRTVVNAREARLLFQERDPLVKVRDELVRQGASIDSIEADVEREITSAARAAIKDAV